MSKNKFEKLMSEWDIQIPLHCYSKSNCQVVFGTKNNSIRISNLKVPHNHDLSELFITEHISLRKFKSENIHVGLYLDSEAWKNKGFATFINELDGEGPVLDLALRMDEKLFNRLYSSIENSGKDFLHQLKFFPSFYVKDLKNIDKFDINSKGKSCEIKDYQIIFSIDN
jgi:hypothetical protein